MRTGLRVLGLGTVAFLASVTLASAADLGGPPAPPYAPYTPEFSWAGFYGGINGGGGWGSADCVSCSAGVNDFSIGGPFVGAQVGYNWQFGEMVLGGEADIQWSGISGSCNGGIGGCGGPPQLTQQEVDYYGTIRARLGWTMGDWLPYLTGGWAYGRGTRTSSVAGAGSVSAGHTGWVAGVGVEYAITPGWSVKAEYQYVNLGNATYNFPVGATPSVGLNIHSLLFGVNAHF
jgi:outer membrane immunogenic protein